MKRVTIVAACFAILAITPIGEAWARGGRGGGGGGGRGASRPAPQPSRSPSMSRPQPKPSTSRPAAKPSAGAAKKPTAKPATKPGTRPSTGAPSKGQVDSFLNLDQASTGKGNKAATAAAAGAGGAAVADFLSQPSTGQRPAKPAAGERPTADRGPKAGDRAVAGQRASSRPEKIKDREQHNEWREDRRNEVREHVNDHPPRWDFWKDHPNWAQWKWNRPYRWATWSLISGWFPGAWNQPQSYYYGDNVYYDDGEVYYGDQAVATTEEYAQQAETIATGAPKLDSEAEWLSLGVFAVTQDDATSSADPTIFLQLAVSKEGVIGGTVHDQAHQKTAEITGMVDKKTQRTAWVIKDKTSPIMETGLANLTKDQAPALLHFGDGQTQQWLLVRLEEPKDQTASP